jgi:hypothetical protein
LTLDVIDSRALFLLNRSLCVARFKSRASQAAKFRTGTSHAADEYRHREARSDSDARSKTSRVCGSLMPRGYIRFADREPGTLRSADRHAAARQ